MAQLMRNCPGKDLVLLIVDTADLRREDRTSLSLEWAIGVISVVRHPIR
jgi:hypothetical protein